MIIVTIHLLSARNGKASKLGELHISNDGIRTQENPNRGTYSAELKRAPRFQSNTRETVVENWPRLNKTVWQLLQKALNQMYPKDVQS